jgi:two-component sensor histidine kinase
VSLHSGYFAYRKRNTTEFEHGRALAEAIVNTVREPLLVLDQDLRVAAASRSFYLTFKASREDTVGHLLYALGDGQWDIPGLRLLLEKIVPEHAVLEYEVAHEFPGIGQRIMLLNARKVFYANDANTSVLLAIEDVTERRAAERQIQDLLRQKELLMEEMQHRIANSLQITASILRLKARRVQSDEARRHLQDASERVAAIAAVQQHLNVSAGDQGLAIGPYLSKLCETLGESMISDKAQVSLDVVATDGTASSSQAVSIALIVTEVVINALKHAFPANKMDGRIAVTFAAEGGSWRLTIADNGVGKSETPAKGGLGTSIINALAEQLDAKVDVLSGPSGTTVSVTHTATPSLLTRAA